MRQAHTVEQVRVAEAALMAQVPDGALMQRAAAGLATAVGRWLDQNGPGGVYGRRVAVLVGSGDNGGDALYAGARLARRGAQVTAVLLSDRAHEGGLAALLDAGGRVGRPSTADVVIDGIVGIGGRPGLRANARDALASYPGIPVVAVDVPSGVDVDTGETPEPHVHADLTVTFGTHKVAHLVNPAASACGVVELVNIGLDLPTPAATALTADNVAALLPRPRPADHKYTRGVVGIRAGSEEYPGAALLATTGANIGLVGMVRYVGSAAEIVKSHHPEVVGPGRVQAWVVGPGGGEEAGSHLREAEKDGVPLVVDADALAHLVAPVVTPALLTPHAGELATMLNTDRDEVERRPLAHVRRAAERFDATVLLKGNRTLIANPDGQVRVNTSGTPWLATAGAGDVLAGLIGALLAAGLEPLDAASVGAWLHGRAGALAAQNGPITARDVADNLAAVIAQLPYAPRADVTIEA